TRITLVFALGTTGPERTLKRKALEYERRLQGDHGRNGGSTYADDGELRVVTEFGSSGARVLKFQTKGMGARSLSTEAEQHIQLEKQFRAVTRSGVVHSGEDIDTLLRGQFQEILGLVIADHL